MISGVGVGVSGTGGSALQAVLEMTKTARTMKMSECCRGLVDTILLYPRLGCKWHGNRHYRDYRHTRIGHLVAENAKGLLIRQENLSKTWRF